MYFKEQFNYHIWMSLSRIIEKRYRRYIGFSPAINSEDLNKDYIINRKGDLFFPILNNQEFFGCVLVREGGSLNSREIKSIYSMIQSIEMVLTDVNASYNQVDEFEAVYDSKKQLINLIGHKAEESQKIACKIQDALSAWSLLPWSDAGMANWSADEMRSLSDICIYVRDILELSPIERQQLLVLGKLPASMRPHLIVCSAKPLADYVNEGTLEPEIAELFLKSSVNLNQLPQDPLRLKEVLEMLLNENQNEKLNEEQNLI